MKKLTMMTMLAACTAAMLCGCTVTKVEYEKNAKGETSYRLYRNGHWLKTEAEGLRGGMGSDGRFEIAVDGLKQSASEEFNRTMQTYTGAVLQLAQIVAAAYNPSASAALQGASGGAAAPTANYQLSTTNYQLPTTNAAECADCVVGGSGAQSPSVAR